MSHANKNKMHIETIVMTMKMKSYASGNEEHKIFNAGKLQK